MTDSRRNTLHDVARLSGVSYQTVSRVINNHPYVSDETRERVQQAIEQLDYRPNRAAQSLAGTKSHTLGMTTFGINNYGPAQMVINIEEASRGAGYDLILANVKDTELTSLHTAINYIRRWEVDGLLVITPIISTNYEALQALCGSIPLVLIGVGVGVDVPSVAVDQEEGTRQMTQHLIDLGHRHFCEISGSLVWFDALERHGSWLKTLHTAGLTPGLSIEGDWTAESGYQATHELLRRGERFTALVVGNDQMALGAIHALREHNLRVPEDISVVGFDDIPEAAYFSPPLTTVRQDFDVLGKLGVEYLIERINNPEIKMAQRVIKPRMMMRASTARPVSS
jgi:DNA-binding LacI/PurR family transcriptional regulator